MIHAFVAILYKHLSKKNWEVCFSLLPIAIIFDLSKLGHFSAVRSSKMTNNFKSSTYIGIRSGQYFYWPDDLVSWFLKLECLQKKQNTSLPTGVLQEKLDEGVRHSSWNPYPISDQNV